MPDIADRLAPVHALISGFVARGEIDGGALAVGLHGRPVSVWHGGMARPGVPAGAGTLWPLASISKLYTAAAVMALVERGALALGTAVSAILPRFSGEGRERVRLSHLLTHTSGLVYESPHMEQRLRDRWSVDQIIAEAYEQRLQFPPGTRISYSDFGYGLAGAAAATVAGMTFPELVQRYVLEPGGLHETFMPPAPADYDRVAHVRGALAEGTAGAMYNSPHGLALAHPAFGTVASAADLLRLGLLFSPGGPRLFSVATTRAMTADQTGGTLPMSIVGIDSTAPGGWGYGFMLRGRADPAGFFGDLWPPESFGHGGASGCMLAVSPADGITIAYVSNRHLNAGLDGFLQRNATVLNTALAALTR